MDAKTFFDKVVKMREAQKTYFKTRRPVDLKKSKDLEKEIDDEIARVRNILDQQINPSLFEYGKDI